MAGHHFRLVEAGEDGQLGKIGDLEVRFRSAPPPPSQLNEWAGRSASVEVGTKGVEA